MAIEITEEMRRAVYAADCARLGHMFNLRNAVGVVADTADGTPAADVRGPDADTLAHLYCDRCPKVWLLVEEPGEDYADAVASMRGRLKDPEWLKPRPRKAPASPGVDPVRGPGR